MMSKEKEVTMLGYIDTIKNFIETPSIEIIEFLTNTYPDASHSQIRSWEVLINDLKTSSELLKINSDTIIAIEYSLAVENMSIDLFWAGSSDGLENIIYIIEAKQWSDEYIYDNKFSTYREENKLLHPQVQVSRYVKAMKDYLSVGKLIHSFKPYVYIRNATTYGCKQLEEFNKDCTSTDIPVTNDLDSLLKNIQPLFTKVPSITINDFRNAIYYPSKSIIKSMESIVTKETPFILTCEQEKVLVTVREAIKQGKKIIRIAGASGSGKTAILLNMCVQIFQKNSSYVPYFVSGAQNTALYRSLYPEIATCFNYSLNLKNSILKAKVKNPIILMDEAQHNQPGIITELLDLGAILVLCYDEGQTINAHNSLNELNTLEKRSDFISIELKDSIRFNGSKLYENNIKKLLSGNGKFDHDDKYEFNVYGTLKELEIQTKKVIKNNSNSTVAVIGLLSDDAQDITRRSNGFIHTNWANKTEVDWIPYVNNKNYLAKYNGSLWVGTWWLPGLDVDYVIVIVGNDARLTEKGLVGDPYHSKNYTMIISVAEKLNFPKYLTTPKKTIDKVKNILNYLDRPENYQKKQDFILTFSSYLRNMYYIMMTRGRKGCYIHFKNNELEN